jgi:hypothetical protein
VSPSIQVEVHVLDRELDVELSVHGDTVRLCFPPDPERSLEQSSIEISNSSSGIGFKPVLPSVNCIDMTSDSTKDRRTLMFAHQADDFL